MFAIHLAIFPFHGKGTLIAHIIEGTDDLFEVDGASSEGAEIPRSTGITEIQVAAKDTSFCTAWGGVCILHMNVVDAVPKLANQADPAAQFRIKILKFFVRDRQRAEARGSPDLWITCSLRLRPKRPDSAPRVPA